MQDPAPDERVLPPGQKLAKGFPVRHYGPISARAWVLIHMQAIRIVSKGIRYIPPSPEPPEETT